jgi:hypothetical protein
MPQAPRFLGAPRRAYSLLCFPKFLFPVSSRGPNSAPVRDPKESKFPRKREAPNFKKRGPKERGPKRFFRSLLQCGAPKSPTVPQKKKKRGPHSPQTFFFPVSVFQRRAPKSPWSPDNVSTQNLKIEVPKSGAPTGFFVPFQRGIQTTRGPKVKKAPKPGRNKCFCSFLFQGAPKSEAKN